MTSVSLPAAVPVVPPLLSVEHLTVRFGEDTAVRDLSLSLQPGEKLALVGESGSGKSVTAHSILRLNPDVSLNGRIHFAGQGDLLALPLSAMRAIRGHDIAMIFQEPMTALNPLYTIGNQITETLTLHLGYGRKAARAEAIALLARTGLAQPEVLIDRYPFQLSGGQRQRAMIAMALACRPKLLIADEPTTALDATLRGQILDLLDDLQREIGMAVLLITHDLNLVRRFADRVAVMQSGQIVETGTVETVFAAPQHVYTQTLLASHPAPLNAYPDPSRPTVLEATGMRVAFAARQGWFGKRQENVVLDSIDLKLAAGETLGIVGESGSGKTTLGLALLQLIPAQGRVVVAGHALTGLSHAALRTLRRKMQVVFQDPFSSLSPRMTVAQIVGEGLALHFPELSAAERDARIVATLEEVGLPAEARWRYPHAFSGGQRQRIAIARALVLRPTVLLLDEPTSALDVSIQKQVLTLLRDLQVRYGVAYLFISHDLAVIRAVAHRVLVLKAGQIVEFGDAPTLFAQPQQAYTRALLAAV